MTIIVAVEHKDGVIVACDSQVTDSGTSFLLHGSQSKIGQNGPYIMGAAGRLRTGQVLIHAEGLPHPPSENLSDADLNRFMINQFAPALQDAMKEAGVETTQDSERLMTESELIVCVQGRAFSVGEDYSVSRAANGAASIHGVAVTGSGWHFALGAYYALTHDRYLVDPDEVVTSMIEAAIYWDQHCGGALYGLFQSRP